MDIIIVSFLFSAICLLLSSYNQVYLKLSSRIRGIIEYQKEKGRRTIKETKKINLFLKRLEYIKYMQLLAVCSLILLTFSIILILASLVKSAKFTFVLSLCFFLMSLIYAIKDIKLINIDM